MYIKDIERWIRGPYYSPEGNSGTGGSDNRGTEADADLLAEGEDDDKKEENKIDNDDDDFKDDSKDNKKRESKDKTDSEREESDNKDDERKFGEEFDEEKGDDDEDEDNKEFDKEEELDEEEKEVENEFTVRALKKEFPNIFKKFPEVKEAIFRERAFTKIFGSVEEAEDAASKSQYLDEISQDIFEGKSENLLKSLKKNSEESLKIFASGFLPELYKTDKELYHEITDHALNQMLHVVNANAMKNGNKNLAMAVKYISQFVFGEAELPELKQLNKPVEKSEAEKKLEERERSYEKQKYSEFEDSVHSRARTKLEALIKEGFADDKTMTDFVKDAITDKIIDQVGTTIAKDKFFQSQLASLWKKAVREGYTGEAKSRIISAYLARAKKIVPSVRAEVRRSASGKYSNNNENENGKRQGTSTGSGKRGSTLPTDPRKIPASMTDEQILEAD